MSARSSADKIASWYGGMKRLVPRTKAEKVSNAIGSGASFKPATPPCPGTPCHCQQPCWTKAVLPFSAEAANAPPQPSTRPAASAASPTTRTQRIDKPPLTRLRPDIDQRRLAGLHDGDRFLDRGPELGRVLDRTLRPPAHGFRQLVILDVRVLDAGAGRAHIIAQARDAVVEVGQALDVHDLLMVAAVVVHHGEKRNFMPRRGPQHARRVHQIAVGLDAHGEPAEIAVGERGADRPARAVAHAVTARRSEPVVVLLHRPEPVRPVADIAGGRHQRPIEVLDLRPDLHGEASRADRARIPGQRRGLLAALLAFGIGLFGSLVALL